MITDKMNQRLTETGCQTPAGQLMRHYWQPVALSDQLAGPRPVVPVEIMGEKLVLFRTKDGPDKGKLGLIARACPHRGVDLCYGRLETSGLRCPFHGFLFSHDGQCLEQPGEPGDKNHPRHFGQAAYPVVERNGLILAYMGGDTPPALPELDCFTAPASHVFAFKGHLDCNWLQALEVGIDPVHASFLHRYLEDESGAESYGRQFMDSSGDEEIPQTWLLRNYPAPDLNVKQTGYGLQIVARRQLDERRTHYRVTNQVFPNAIVIPMSRTMAITQWHIPIDDRQSYWFAAFTSYSGPVDKALMRAQRLELYQLPDYRPKLNRGNHWGYDPAEQESQTYTGMGMDINVHDQWAVESPGQLSNRSAEHLVSSDQAIARYRAMLNRAMRDLEAGDKAKLPLYKAGDQGLPGPAFADMLEYQDRPKASWQNSYQQLRQNADWEPEK